MDFKAPMKSYPLAGVSVTVSLALLTMSIIIFFMTPTAAADSLTKLQARLPQQINGWKADPEDHIFDTTTIFSYINGAAEIYKAYNMRQCLARRYSTPGGPAIVIDIFEMGSSEDAYGVFTHDLDGEVIDVGQDARLRPGWLSFWKHRFFVSIYMEEETTAAQKTVRELGRRVAGQIPATGTKPRILSLLPPEGLASQTIRYMHHPTVLNYHFYIADENILNISHRTDALLASYHRGGQKATLLLVLYPNREIALKSLSSFLKHYLPEADKTGAVLLENGKWSAVQLKERLLVVVLESQSRKFAENLLKTVSQNPD